MANNYGLRIILLITAITVCFAEYIFNPKAISSILLSSREKKTVFFFTVSDDSKYAFVSMQDGNIYVVSLSDIQQPTYLTTIKTTNSLEMEYMNGYLFVTDYVEGIIIVDVSDPANPKRIYTSPTPMTLQALAITADMKYGYFVGLGIVHSYDLSTITSPKLLSSIGVASPTSYKLRLDPSEQFVAVSNNIFGMEIIDVRVKDNIKLRGTQYTPSAAWDCFFTPDLSHIYVVDAYYGLLLAPVTDLFLIDKDSADTFTITFTYVYQSSQLMQSVAMIDNGNYLLLGVRSVGLKLFQINSKNYYNPVFVQKIEGSYLCTKIMLSKDEKYAFAVNGLSFIIYLSGSPSINKEFPNIFNSFQSSIVDTYNTYWGWEVQCFNDNQHIVVAGSDDSTRIYSIADPASPTVLAKIPSNSFISYDGVHLTNESVQNIMYLGESSLGFFVYDITDKANPVKLTEIVPLSFLQTNDSDGIYVNADNSLLLIANGSPGISLYDIKTNRSSPQLIGHWINYQFLCTFERCIITADKKYFYCSCREQGLVTFLFDGSTITFSSIMPRTGCEDPILSADESIIFVAVGFQGLIILDNSLRSSQTIISTLPLDGWAQTIKFFSSSYIIAAQLEKGTIVVVNIEDLTNPYVFSKTSFPSENAASLCITPDQKNMYSIGNTGLRRIPLAVGITIHTQLSRQTTSSSGNTFYEILDGSTKLQVGEMIQMVFVPLYTSRSILLDSVTYYRQYQKNTLPSWMTFIPIENMIQFTVNKEGALNLYSTENKGENVIILNVFLEVTYADLVTSIITQTMAAVIISSLTENGYLDDQGYLQTSVFFPERFTALNFYNSQFPAADYASQDASIQLTIKEVLTASKIEYPVRFFVESSLKFRYAENRTQTGNNLLSTPSANLVVQFLITANAVFVKKTFEGVIVSFSDDLTSLKIDGYTDKVNEIVSKDIQIANKTMNFDQITFTTKISDSNNYDLAYDNTFTELSFIGLNNPVYLNTNNDLQTQFNRNYGSGHVYVEEKFSFSFNEDTFSDKDRQTLTYTAYLVTDPNNKVQITSDAGKWIQFSASSLSFTVQKSAGSLRDSERIQIIASDGYVEASDVFEMNFYLIPILYVIQMIVTIVGPIIGAFGIWNYRAKIYLIVMESQYTYSNQQAQVGVMFQKQIVLIEKLQEEGEKLWNLFLKKYKNQKKAIREQYKKNSTVDMKEIMALIKESYLAHFAQFKDIVDPREFDHVDSRMYRIIQGYIYGIILKKDLKTQQALLYLRQCGEKSYKKTDWYCKYLTITPSFELIKNKVVPINFNAGQGEDKYFDMVSPDSNTTRKLFGIVPAKNEEIIEDPKKTKDLQKEEVEIVVQNDPVDKEKVKNNDKTNEKANESNKNQLLKPLDFKSNSSQVIHDQEAQSSNKLLAQPELSSRNFLNAKQEIPCEEQHFIDSSKNYNNSTNADNSQLFLSKLNELIKNEVSVEEQGTKEAELQRQIIPEITKPKSQFMNRIRQEMQKIDTNNSNSQLKKLRRSRTNQKKKTRFDDLQDVNEEEKNNIESGEQQSNQIVVFPNQGEIERLTSHMPSEGDPNEHGFQKKNSLLGNVSTQGYMYRNLSPFQKMEPLEDVIKTDLNLPRFQNYDHQLLMQMLILEASGIRYQGGLKINPAQGECLHLFAQDLHRVTAYKKDYGYCMKLREYLKADFLPIGLNGNSLLPRWLKCEIVDGVVYMWGIPKPNDDRHFAVRFIDQMEFTVESFMINISSKKDVLAALKRQKTKGETMVSSLASRMNKLFMTEKVVQAINTLSGKDKKENNYQVPSISVIEKHNNDEQNNMKNQLEGEIFKKKDGKGNKLMTKSLADYHKNMKSSLRKKSKDFVAEQKAPEPSSQALNIILENDLEQIVKMNESLAIVKQEEKDPPPPTNKETNVKKVISFDPEALKLHNNNMTNASYLLTNNNTVNFTTLTNLQSPMNTNINSPSNQSDGPNNQDDKLLLQYSVKDNIIDFSQHSDK